MTVLVVTNETDHAADLVVHELNRRDVPVLRLHTGRVAGLDAHLRSGRWTGQLSQDGRTVDLGDVRSVFWRRSEPPPGSPRIADQAARQFAAREDAHGLLGVVKTLPCRWMSHPDAIAAADSKPMQLLEAAHAGLAVPDTAIVTGRGQALAALGDGPILYKAFQAMGRTRQDAIKATAVHAADVPDELGHIATFQRVIDGPPIRVIVVDGRAWAVVISVPGTDLDWRPRQHEATYAQVEIPAEVGYALSELHKRWRLTYGAWDFMRDADGQWWLLECNPTGQYGAIAIRAGLPITEAICDYLTG